MSLPQSTTRRNPQAGPRLIEFFCGIGGMACAAAQHGAEIVLAIDQERSACATYEHNHGLAPSPRNICNFTANELLAAEADGWLLSPPCQPFTQKGKGLDDQDPRTQPLLHLVDLLPRCRPGLLFLENVPPFAVSRTHEKLLAALAAAGLHVLEAEVCPTDFGIPNRRRRYYLLASSRLPEQLEGLQNGRHGHAEALCEGGWSTCPSKPEGRSRMVDEVPPKPCAKADGHRCHGREGVLTAYLDENPGTDLLVPERDLERLAKTDIIQPDGVAACFGSSYGHALRRSGSYLAAPELGGTGIRRFSPEEILRLLHFPDGFAFPPELTFAQRYRLAGNSVNVAVVSHLLGILLA